MTKAIALSYSLSARYEERPLASRTYHLLVHQLNNIFPNTHFHPRTEIPRHPSSLPLPVDATFFDYVVLNGQRYHASPNLDTATARSLVQVQYHMLSGDTRLECGELLEIFRYDHGPNRQPLWFGHVRWFVPWRGRRDQM
ncbi:hypothetical protein FA95DRAFT_1405115 [Auriscalpium vulgare]|uniref:Uncharacterized protein n=1 Tax=Auriscalpium vulgare TaxID=40419 RepID=A0ACB8RQL6_9AGAM|nr:hypothetical protein FA95DRAFT_1405115 [Auriscalpium vulgare]